MLHPMREELFKYRKRKKVSLDGSVPGVPYTHFRRSRRHVSGMPHIPGRPGYSNGLYMSGSPREYRPSLNAPSAQSEDYLMDENWDWHNTSNPTDSKLFRPFPELPAAEEVLTHEKSKSASEFFLKVMEVMYQPFEEGQEIPTLADIWQKHCSVETEGMPDTETAIETMQELTPDDVAHKFMDLLDAHSHLQKVFSQEHADVRNLRAAISNIINDPDAMSKLESLTGDITPSKLGTGNPYELDFLEDTEQIFEQPIHMAEEQLGLPEMVFEEAMSDASFSEEQTLEEIVQHGDPFEVSVPGFMEDDIMPNEIASGMEMPTIMPEMPGYDVFMVEDEINQAIDQAIEPPMPYESEPDPFDPQYDPFRVPEYMMMDPQMQYMMQYMMPGTMPCGPMGPGPMMPGPQMM